MKIICPKPTDFSKEILISLKKKFECNFKNISQTQLDKTLKNYDVVLTRFNHKIKFNTAKHLKYILSPTTGIDHIDKKYLKSKTKLISLKGETEFLKKINASTEFSIYLMLKALREFKVFENKFSQEINGKQIGIIGYGRIGKKIKPILEKMGAKVYINDIKKNIIPKLKYKPLKELIKSSDILTFHIPLNSKNEGIFDKNIVNQFKKNMIIINTSRGEIFNEKELLKKMKKNKVFYATDVLGKYFLKHLKNKKIKKKIIFTNHIAGLTNESVKLTDNFILKNFLTTIKTTNN